MIVIVLSELASNLNSLTALVVSLIPNTNAIALVMVNSTKALRETGKIGLTVITEAISNMLVVLSETQKPQTGTTRKKVSIGLIELLTIALLTPFNSLSLPAGVSD
jgi:uncharacterized protein YaaN involved in tellurite resistance